MSFLKSNFNLCVLTLPEEFSVKKMDAYDKLLKNQFRNLSASDESGHGWVDLKEFDKTDFDFDKVCFGTNMALGYRIDKKSVPKKLLKSNVNKAVAKRRKAGEKVNADLRTVIKDECKAQLVMKALPTPKHVHWIWDFDLKCIYLDTHTDKVVQNFKELFQKTFEVNLELKQYNLSGELLNNFLDWIWVNEPEQIKVDDNIVLSSSEEKTNFNYQSQSLENYEEYIDQAKENKLIKKLNIVFQLKNINYKVKLNDTNLFLSVESEPKIKGSDSEPIILDITDRITTLVKKFETLGVKFLGLN